jgi:hypothetical protein
MLATNPGCYFRRRIKVDASRFKASDDHLHEKLREV